MRISRVAVWPRARSAEYSVKTRGGYWGLPGPVGAQGLGRRRSGSAGGAAGVQFFSRMNRGRNHSSPVRVWTLWSMWSMRIWGVTSGSQGPGCWAVAK